MPIVSEQYEKYGVKYYGVAVVRKNNTGFNLTSLQGKKSCHTGARRTAGWNVPVGYLLREGIMQKAPCDGGDYYDLKAASKFFSESCVPGKEYISSPPWTMNLSRLKQCQDFEDICIFF